jgi:hypothetical protein
MGSDDSSSSFSSEDFPTAIHTGPNSFLVQVDPRNATVDVTPLTLGGATGSVQGAALDLSEADGACSWAGTDLTCDLVLTNLSSNTITFTTKAVVVKGSCQDNAGGSGSCATATLSNADYPLQGNTVGPYSYLLDSNSAGICYTENGGDSNIVTVNPEGCSFDTIDGKDYAITMLLPGGGNQLEPWVFGNATNRYSFVTVLEGSQWAPLDVTQDARFDMTDYSTWVFKFYDDDNLNAGYCGLGFLKNGWQIGTPWCSTEISGGSATGTIYLNMMSEFADRVENGAAAVAAAWDGCPGGGVICPGGGFDPTSEAYEYYALAQIELSYDPAVLQLAAAGNNVNITPCKNSAVPSYTCGKHPEFWKSEAWAEDSQYNAQGDPRINTLQSRLQQFDYVNGFWYNQTVQTNIEGTGKCWLNMFAFGYPTNGFIFWPHKAGLTGMVDFTGGATACTGSGCPTCNLVGGADADWDFWFGFVQMNVIGASGDYSPVKLIPSNSSTMFIFHSNGTAAGGPSAGDDINQGGVAGWCYSPNGGETFWDDCAGTPCCNVNPRQACTGSPNNVVSRQLEKTNCDLPPAMGHSRVDCAEGDGFCGGKQAQNTFITVQ